METFYWKFLESNSFAWYHLVIISCHKIYDSASADKYCSSILAYACKSGSHYDRVWFELHFHDSCRSLMASSESTQDTSFLAYYFCLTNFAWRFNAFTGYFFFRCVVFWSSFWHLFKLEACTLPDKTPFLFNSPPMSVCLFTDRIIPCRLIFDSPSFLLRNRISPAPCRLFLLPSLLLPSWKKSSVFDELLSLLDSNAFKLCMLVDRFFIYFESILRFWTKYLNPVYSIKFSPNSFLPIGPIPIPRL